jgi:bifunctional non-homologous end joining protein LigD
MVNDLASLVWAANLANLELHTFLSTCRNLSRPSWMVFDLDPGPPAHILQCARVAIWLREKLQKLRLQSFAKTSGSKGLQVYVPLNTAVTFTQSRMFAQEMARWLEEEHSDLIVSKMTKNLRKGKVFIDWSQNHEHKTTICVYSLRGKEQPTVSTPVTWPEVEKALRGQKQAQLSFIAKAVLDRVKKTGDLFQPVLRLKQRLPVFKRVD